MGVSSKGAGSQGRMRRVLVRGGGIVGRSLAMLLAKDGVDVVLAERATAGDERKDPRAYALNAASVGLLQGLRVWPHAEACPVYDMQVWGDKGGALDFSAWRQAVDVLAYIVPAAAVEQMLDEALAFQPRIERVGSDVASDLPGVDTVVICEGRESPTRQQFGFEMDIRPYGHSALAARLVCTQAHGCVARQWFSGKDVLALLPLADRREVSLVWSMPAERAQAMKALSAADFEEALVAATQAALGKVALQTPVVGWDLRFACARHWLMRRHGQVAVLAGDAAHAMHPLAGQGLNVGLGDVAALARVWREAPAWRALGDERILRAYERERRAAFMKMGGGCDAVFDLFMSSWGFVCTARNCGMSALNVLPPLKHWLASQARDV